MAENPAVTLEKAPPFRTGPFQSSAAHDLSQDPPNEPHGPGGFGGFLWCGCRYPLNYGRPEGPTGKVRNTGLNQPPVIPNRHLYGPRLGVTLVGHCVPFHFSGG